MGWNVIILLSHRVLYMAKEATSSSTCRQWLKIMIRNLFGFEYILILKFNDAFIFFSGIKEKNFMLHYEVSEITCMFSFWCSGDVLRAEVIRVSLVILLWAAVRVHMQSTSELSVVIVCSQRMRVDKMRWIIRRTQSNQIWLCEKMIFIFHI